MDSVRGKQKELFERVLTAAREPIATMPSVGTTREFLRAVVAADGEDSQTRPVEIDEDRTIRLLLARDVPDELDWRTRSLAVELRDAGVLGIRTGVVSDVVVAGVETVGMIDRTASHPVGVIGDADVQETYRDRWQTGERVRFQSHSQGELIELVENVIGPTAAETVAEEATRDPARQLCNRGIDPIKLLVWAGAAAEGRAPEVIEVVDRLGIASPRSVERRIDELREEGLIQTPPIHDGQRGRPERRLVVGVTVDDPTDPPDRIRAGLV